MEQVLTGLAAFARELLVSADKRVADSTLAVALESTNDVLAPRDQTIDQVVVRESNNTLGNDKPGLPLLF